MLKKMRKIAIFVIVFLSGLLTKHCEIFAVSDPQPLYAGKVVSFEQIKNERIMLEVQRIIQTLMVPVVLLIGFIVFLVWKKRKKGKVVKLDIIILSIIIIAIIALIIELIITNNSHLI